MTFNAALHNYVAYIYAVVLYITIFMLQIPLLHTSVAR